MSNSEVRKVVVISGTELEVIASEPEAGLWQLAVRNPLGISTAWTEWFPSAEHAIKAGTDAIQAEGLAEFMDIEGFEYLTR
jgi:hypothetical protein